MPRFDPEAILRALIEHDVEFVLIGGIAATLYGSNLRTGDVDICPRKQESNLARLAKALEELEARVRTEGVPDGLPLTADAAFLARVEMLNLTTRHGDFDLTFQPSGTTGFDDLWASHVIFDLDGMGVPTTSLTDLIRSKESAGRDKDHEALPTLRPLLGEVSKK
jgi:predicted nucleotidyltransferase